MTQRRRPNPLPDMPHLCKLLPLLFGCLASTSFSQEYLVEGKFDVRPSWGRASVYLPGKIFPAGVDVLEAAGERDAVVFLHGCTGIKNDEISWAKFLNGLGYVVVLPDSFAIKGRPLNCNPSSFTTNTGAMDAKLLFRVRASEVRQARQNLNRMPNIKKIYLMGFSEGAAVVNLVSRSGLFDGIVSISSHCTGPVNVPKDVPALTIDFESDPYFKSENFCAVKYRGHDKYKQVVLPGGGHEAMTHKMAEAAIKEFLSKH